MVVSSEWKMEDTAALKSLITEFSKRVGDGLSQILAKLIGPADTLDRLEFLFKKNGIQTVARRETDIKNPTDALFYGHTGRLRVAFSS